MKKRKPKIQNVSPNTPIEGNPVAKSLGHPMNHPKTEPLKKGKGSYKRKDKHKNKDID